MNLLNVETIGFIATGLTLSSFLFSNMVRLRTVNLVGCLWWCAYALAPTETQYPVLIVNLAIMAIHSFWLIKYNYKKFQNQSK
jgi:hypothetical protein